MATPAESSPLARVVFTGRLASIGRAEAAALVQRAGGAVCTTVSRRTSMLVVGADGWPLRRDGSVSRSLLRAEELNAAAAGIDIVSEREFLERTGAVCREDAFRKTHPLERIAALIGVAPATVRRWELLGLIRSAEGRCDFRDIVSLRVIADLVRRGVSPQVIGRSMRGLRSLLPDVEHPLAQLTIVEGDEALLAEIGDALVTPEGQLVFNFAAGATGATAPPAALKLEARREELGPVQWLERGLALEQEERFEEAALAYREALARRPGSPEAHFNLGNALRALGELDEAEERLLTATALDPHMAAAWYNLADLQEERGRLDDAIASLSAALRAWPDFPDAHYNMAVFCEMAGRLERAAEHWRAYLRLDPASAWGRTARLRLAGLSRPQVLACAGPRSAGSGIRGLRG
jgi:tetratricopeptide (TPR) repeat protein